MAYSLVPIIDVGPSERRPGLQQRMPLGLDEGGHSVHLGADRALLWTPADVADARVTKLADSPDEIPALATRAAIATLRGDGRALGGRVGDVLADLLLAPPGGQWNPLVATREGVLEVRLGPGPDNAIWSRRVAPRGRASQDIQDTFNRADSALSGSTSSDSQFTWSLPQGTSAQCNIVSNQLKFTRSGANNFFVCLASLAMDTADHYAQVDFISSVGTGNTAVEVGVRITNGTGASDSGYAFAITPLTSRRIYNFVTDATIASDLGLSSAGLMYLELNGSTYTAKLAGATIFTGTDTAFDGSGSQRKVVIDASVTASDLDNIVADSFRAADLAGGLTTAQLMPAVNFMTAGGGMIGRRWR